MTEQEHALRAAIQADLQGFSSMIMTAMLDLENRMNNRFESMEKRFDGKLDSLEHRMLVAMENIRHDVNGMYNDKIGQHEDRIVRIEKHLQLAA